jgi:Flp pilus assembly pilin Flp
MTGQQLRDAALSRGREMVQEEAGQGLTEYALILFFIAVVCIAALTFLGSDISSLLSSIANSL